MDSPRKVILIIDDEPSIGEMVRDYLTLINFTAFYADSPEKGMQILRKERPSLVFLDVLMPKTNGIECLKDIKEISPETIVVMVTAVHDEKTAKLAISYGAYDYLTKPIDFTYLKENILSRIFPEDI